MSVKYSIIVPNYNHANFLKQRLDSVINQTYCDFELIILDDNSKDASKEIINQYRNHRKISHIIFNEVNSGSAFNQWKKGLSLAKGEYVWIAESDDYSELTFLEEMNEILDLNCEIAFCQSIMFSENKIAYQSKSDLLRQVYFGPDFMKKRMGFNNSLFNASMVVFKKDLIKNVDFGKLGEFKFCGDWFFWLELLKNANIGESAKCLNYFRKHSSDLSGKSNFNGVMLSEFIEIQKYLKKISMISKSEYFKNILQKFDSVKNSEFKSIENIQIIRNHNSTVPKYFSFIFYTRKKIAFFIKIIRCFRS
jgi:glycosyltransferase involved in cell wall biosynthesis